MKTMQEMIHINQVREQVHQHQAALAHTKENNLVDFFGDFSGYVTRGKKY